MATYVITIAGATKALQPGWSIAETANGRARLSAAVKSTDASFRPAIGAEVIISEDGTPIFAGYIDTPVEQGIGGDGVTGIITTIGAVDYNSLADRRSVVNGGFPAGYTVKQALTSLVGWLTDYGVTLHASQVDGPALPLLVYDVRTVSSILDEISVITGYLWSIDYTKKLRAFAPGALTAPVSITTANRFAEGDVTAAPARTAYANYIILLAGTGTAEVTDTFTGDGVTTTFTLTYRLYSDRGYITNGAANETLGTGATWTYNSATNQITRTSAPANLNAISITYIAQFPYAAVADGGAAAADRVDKVITAPDTFSATVAQALADGYLARSMASETQTVRYRTRQVGIHPGQTQTITVAGRNISGTYLVTDVTTVNASGNVVFRDVTAVSGTEYPGSWRDAFRVTGGSTGSTVGGTVNITTGGTGGSGTIGKIAKWTATSTIGDSIISESGSTVTVPGTVAATLFTGSGASLLSLPAAELTGTITSATQDLITRLGTIVSGVWNAGAGTFGGHVVPSLTDTYDLGSPTKWWRFGYLSQLNAVLFTKETQSLYGGWLSVNKNAGVFAAAVGSGDTTINFGQAMTANQFVVVRAADTGGTITSEFIKVVSLSSGTTYNVTRNLSGIGAKNWAMGTAYAVRGVAGDGWLELNAFDTPRMSVLTQGSAYNNSVETIRIGHLTGMPNSSSGIGSYMGDSTNYSRWDGTTLTIVSANVTINSSGLTLGDSSSFASYVTSSALKFTRPTSSQYGQTGDRYGVYNIANGSRRQHDRRQHDRGGQGADLPAGARVEQRRRRVGDN
jgi:hypothetical protein